MQLSEYQWSKNPRGMHNNPLNQQIDHARYQRAGFGWAKLVVTDDRWVSQAASFLAEGITPIVRIWRPSFGASPFSDELRRLTDLYLGVGVKWFEFYNEPNVPGEWPEGTTVDWRNTDGLIRPLMDNWLAWAEYIVSRSAYPGFVALTEALGDNVSAPLWMTAMLNYLAQAQFERFRSVITRGLFAATHPYILNHYYQDVPGAASGTPRQPQDQRAGEPGWHFEYPYDAISQRSEPGISVSSGPPWKPHGDPVGLAAMGQYFNERIVALFGAQTVPVVGTEGGIFPFPHPGQSIQPDPRYPPITHESHAEATLAMFEWITYSAPEWLFGVCLWKEDDYYDTIHARAIDRLEQTPPILKFVTGSGSAAPGYGPAPARGPGPIHGDPTFHFVIFSPDLDPEWFFQTAISYWTRYRPVVMVYDPDLIDQIPYDRSLAVTVISTPVTADDIKTDISIRYPHVLIDMIVASGDMEIVREVLNKRVQDNARFGVLTPTSGDGALFR